MDELRAVLVQRGDLRVCVYSDSGSLAVMRPEVPRVVLRGDPHEEVLLIEDSGYLIEDPEPEGAA